MGVVRKLKKLISIPQVYTKTRNDYPEMKLVQYLRQWNSKLKQDEKGNLYLINPGTPLLCAHMDTRQELLSTNYNTLPGVLKIEEGILKTGHCLGADDKCGIAIAMQIYEELGDDVSLLFTVQEESGLHGAKHFVENERALLDTCLYCIIPDRKGGSDIIGWQNGYCSLDFQSKVAAITADAGYLPVPGVLCDADIIKTVLNCVNMSCGYLYHHTDKEQVNIDEFYNAYCAVYNVVIGINIKMPIYKAPVYNTPVYNTPSTYSSNKSEEHKTKYENNTKKDKKNRKQQIQKSLLDKYGEEVMNDIPFVDDDYDEEVIEEDDRDVPLSNNRGDLQRQKELQSKYNCNIKIKSRKHTVLFEEDTQILSKNGKGEIIDIPNGEYWFFKGKKFYQG